MLFIYLIIALAQLRLRARLELENPAALAIRMWLYPYATWATIGGMLAVLALMGFSEAHASELWASVLVTLGFLIAYAVKRQLAR
jgi:GABA permease